MQLRYLGDDQELNTLLDTIAKEFTRIETKNAELQAQVDDLLVKNRSLAKQMDRTSKQFTVSNRVALKSIKFGETRSNNADRNGLYVTPAGVLEFKSKQGKVSVLT